MSKSKLGGIVATMEDLAQAANSDTDEVAAAETAADVAEVAGEMAIEENTIEGTDTALADAEVAEDKLDELTDVAEASLAGEGEEVAEGEVGEEGDGMSEGEVAMVEITHESIMNMVGMSFNKVHYTSESFSAPKTKRDITIATLEELDKSSKSLGQNIIAGLKAALNTVIGFIAGLLRNRALLEKHLVNLQTRLKSLPANAAPKTDKIKVSGKLGVTAQSAMEILGNTSKIVGICATISAAVEKGSAAVAQAITSSGANGLKVQANKTLKTETPEGGGATISAVDEGTLVTEAAPLARADMDKILNQSLAAVKELRVFDKTQNQLKSAVNNLLSRLQEGYHSARAKASDMTGNKESSEAQTAAGALKADARMARQMMSKVGGLLPGIAFGNIKAGADFVTASIKAYGNGEGAAAAAPEAAAEEAPAKPTGTALQTV